MLYFSHCYVSTCFFVLGFAIFNGEKEKHPVSNSIPMTYVHKQSVQEATETSCTG